MIAVGSIWLLLVTPQWGLNAQSLSIVPFSTEVACKNAIVKIAEKTSDWWVPISSQSMVCIEAAQP